MAEVRLAELQRKEVFLALVEAQDNALTVAASRKAVAERLGVSEGPLKGIEQEGLDKACPPLGGR